MTQRVDREIDRVADAMLAAYQQQIVAYGLLDDPSLLSEVRAGTRVTLAVVLNAIGVDRELTDRELDALKEIGHRRAAQGFPLHALLHAYQVGTRTGWEQILVALGQEVYEAPVAAELVAKMSISILGIMGQISGAVTQAYLETERITAATEERLRRDVFNELIWGATASSEPLRERAARVGYRLGEEHSVTIVSIEIEDHDSDALARIRQAAASALRDMQYDDAEPVVDVRNGLVVSIVPTAEGTSERDIVARTLDALGRSTPIAGWEVFAAIGRIETGVSGITTSFRQALRALDVAKSLGLDGSVVSYVDLLPSILLLNDANATMDLYRSTIEPLVRHDGEHGTQLVTTLETLLEERGNGIATAKRLFVHRHTLAARLERIEELSRRSLKSHSDLTLLDLGLRARAVLPAVPGGPTIGRMLDGGSTRRLGDASELNLRP